MHIPILSGIRELGAAPRKFLFFMTINVISWQCVVGQQVLPLFGRAIDMPQSWVGILLSFMPLSMLLVVLTVPLIERLGPRRLLMFSWTLRNIMVLSIFATPWAIAQYGPSAGWKVVLFATLSFCLSRAIGVGAWYPWLHEVVPRKRHGTYFATETALVQVTTIVLLLGIAYGLSFGKSPNRFLWIYALGIVAGFYSVYCMLQIPGGRKSPETPDGDLGWFGAFRIALADRDYMKFIFPGCLGHVALTWIGASNVLFMRDVLGYGDDTIMYLIAAGCLGSAFTARYWGRYADRHGSGPALVLILVGHALIGFAWIALDPKNTLTNTLVAPLVVLYSIFNAAFWTVASRGMLCRIKERGRVGYTNLWIIAFALGMGVTPILAGQIVERWDHAGFRFCFLAAGLTGLLAALGFFFLPQEEGKPPTAQIAAILRPTQPLRTLGRITWITLGLEERDHERQNNSRR